MRRRASKAGRRRTRRAGRRPERRLHTRQVDSVVRSVPLLVTRIDDLDPDGGRGEDVKLSWPIIN